MLIEEWNLGVRGTLLPGWRAEASASLSNYRGGAPNRRVAGVVGVTRRLAPDWNAGIAVRAYNLSSKKKTELNYKLKKSESNML